jgi:outer membrane lipoprotein SlyB
MLPLVVEVMMLRAEKVNLIGSLLSLCILAQTEPKSSNFRAMQSSRKFRFTHGYIRKARKARKSSSYPILHPLNDQAIKLATTAFLNMLTLNSPKILWSAVAVLGASTISLAAMLVRNQVEAPVVMTLASDSTLVSTEAKASINAPANGQANGQTSEQPASPPQGAGARIAGDKAPTPSKPKVVHSIAVKPAPQSSPMMTQDLPAKSVLAQDAKPYVVEHLPPKVICSSCGTVESVVAVQREPASGSGIGVIAGVAIGGLLGNQVGGGTGKDIATIAGMAAGGWAGNAVEKKMKKETVYEVAVRMEDGSSRKLERKSPMDVGTRVTLDGNTIVANGAGPVAN